MKDSAALRPSLKSIRIIRISEKKNRLSEEADPEPYFSPIAG